MSVAELAYLDAINGYRLAQGQAAWQADAGLAAVARAHSRAMARAGQFSHEGFAQRARGTGSALCVENLLHGKATPARAVQLWLRSGAHRDNLLEAGARFAGVGMAGPYLSLLACATPPAATAALPPTATDPDPPR